MSFIFISYSRHDAALVDRLAADLKAAKHEVWLDRRRITGGSQWRGEIARAIRGCRVFIIALSGHSAESRYVRQELDAAAETGCLILPLMLESIDIPDHLWLTLAGLHRIDVHTDYDRALLEIINALGAPAKGGPSPPPQEPVDEWPAPPEPGRPPATPEAVDGAGPGWIVLFDRNGFSYRNVPIALGEKLDELNENAQEIKRVAMTPHGGWLILHDDNGYSWRDIPPGLETRLERLNESGVNLRDAAIAADGGWVVLYDDIGFAWANIPAGLRDRLNDLNDAGERLKQVLFFSDAGWLVLHGFNGYSWSEVPPGLLAALNDVNEAHEELLGIAARPAVDGEQGAAWVLLTGSTSRAYRHDGVTGPLAARLAALRNEGARVKAVIFDPTRS